MSWITPLQVDWRKRCSHCKVEPKEDNCGYCKWCKKTYNKRYWVARSRPVVIKGRSFKTMKAAARHFKCSYTKLYGMLGEKRRAGRSFYRT